MKNIVLENRNVIQKSIYIGSHCSRIVGVVLQIRAQAMMSTLSHFFLEAK